MKHISITGKFFVLLASFGLFTLALAYYAGSQILRVDADYSRLVTTEGDASTSLSRASQTFQTIRGAIGDSLLTTAKEQERKAQEELTASRTLFIAQIDHAASSLPKDGSIAELKAKAMAVLDQSCANTIALGAKALTYLDIKNAMDVFFRECQPQFQVMSKALNDKVDELATATANSTAGLSADARGIYWTTIGGVLAALLIISAISFVAIRTWLVHPIQALGLTMGRLSGGDLSADVAGGERKDEIGGMARAVLVFKESGLRALTLETDAASERDQSEQQQRRTAEQDRRRSVAMTEATQGLAEGLKHLASGDLSFRLDKSFAEDFESLRADFNRTVEQLCDTLAAVTTATGSIDSGAREVSHSADDLSRRTEQQAASLEETAAALDEITANVANSSKRAEEARTVAIQANESARTSEAVVADAVRAMSRIEQSSSQISSIIGVIDDIAFQTNLLALNAGVEAARAGEAGKGFAVVAQEVRELAQRSATAAKEIKDLIRNSSAEVGSGVKLVSATGDALKTIEAYVATINQHMDAIATSAREQSTGLAEVNNAVNQMDQVTQQNAAMVEEANAAGATLASEAGRLRELVSQFQLGDAHARHLDMGKPTSAEAPQLSAHGASVAASLRRSLSVRSADERSRPKASPAHHMADKLSHAFGGKMSGPSPAAANAADDWEEF
ncbi:methyl-accepting chemotaxis protein [Aliirhizobium smilacinae]|uniref:Methyl-accepting chemotaxis protein n=1 Tax=Aliirhizobium smilacinae TaxID=1395944 RepID=A0A5C4XGF3_9HYPH|nr:methyl-accepting chemotaxis protein [Rhizobium smilacinae]TNM62605.1 methyl-accepting chemotaxis protein [Rhizobium smilacinae]